MDEPIFGPAVHHPQVSLEALVVEWLLPVLGFAVGVYGSLVGAGGGFLLVPALLLLYPTANASTITSISLMVVFWNAASGSVAYARARRIDYRTATIFALATFPGAIVGAVLVSAVPRGPFDVIFGVVLLVIAAVTLRWPEAKPEVLPRAQSGSVTTRVVIDGTGVRHEYSFRMWQGVLICLGVGLFSSLLGIGGGIVLVPAMVLLLSFPAHIATATSQIVLACMALAGSAVHVMDGELRPGSGFYRSIFLAAGVIPGAQVGAWLSTRFRGPVIVRLLGVGLLVVGLRLLLTAANG